MTTKFGRTTDIVVAVLRVIIVILTGGMVRPRTRGNTESAPATL